ncbi:hypothetical protein E1B28_012494 [Marasmius oreades]|uniref:POP1-domain-containing protein n=1 Tax=Marasmius oreades TaxID=181124 RepID=A0A9P7RSE8_9AGAR|nr:uncharacterized protein E1B28_012494 [Marasmius oreades]KAG7088510.1 hypothetical protein E1B28_012494 [Marasmius oreades]
MAPKRAAEDNNSFRARKKQKLSEVRQIAVQDQNGSITNLGPVIHDSMKNLPGAIDVEKFAESRSYEINAMQNAIKTASTSSTHRAWQLLPRHLRRRAASHDPRRVPVRLRAKAKAEMDPVKKKAQGRSRPKLGKSKRLPKSQVFLKRQRDKRWLESHIWHAKRMHMKNMWGFRLAITPTEKSFRPSHRASKHGSILHDASYQSLIELRGPQATLRLIFEMVCDCVNVDPTKKRFIDGSRTVEADFYQPGFYPFKLIGPVIILWRPPPPPPPQETSGSQGKKGKGKGKAKAKAKATPQDELTRTAWIFCHPGLFEDVFTALRTATSIALSSTSKVEVELADLRGQLNVFELMGPKSCQVLKGALSPVMDDAEFKQFWDYLGKIQNSGSLPRNMVVGFKVHDPRLNFPPKNSKPQNSNQPSFSSSTYPTSALARSDLWDETTRVKLKQPRFKKQDLDERRAKSHLIPGTPLSSLPQDDCVPLMLIQTSIVASEQDTEGVHGFTLLLPAGWSMAFLSSLIHTGTRVGGQRERAHQAFEAGRPYFPRDFPGTDLYSLHTRETEEDEKAKWERTPPAKKPNYEKLGTRSPWRADWEVVLGLNTKEGAKKNGAGFLSTQREPELEHESGNNDMDVDKSVEIEYDIPPWVLRGKGLLEAVSRDVNVEGVPGAAAIALHTAIENARKNHHLDLLPPEMTPEILLKSALVTIKLSPCGRGAPTDLAVISSIPDAEVKDCLLLRNDAGKLTNANTTDTASNPSTDSIIGYVTTGGFSLSRGEGFAIGCISLVKYLELKRQRDRLLESADVNKDRRSRLFVKVRERDGQQCRLASVTPVH